MSDWQVGDRAVCVRPTNWLAKGSVYRVAGIVFGKVAGAMFLRVERDEMDHGFYAYRFRKIRPDTHEPCEAEFKTLLKRKRVSA